MQKKLHLIGEADIYSVNLLIERLEALDEKVECKYNEASRDLQLNTENKDIVDEVNSIIEELSLNIRTVERKRGRRPSNVEFEKRVFLFSDLQSAENGVFLVSYLLNDSQIREARFDYRQKILTVETTDPFIFNKISKVVEAFEEDITITESYSKEKTFDIRLMYQFFMMAVLFFSIALIIVTLEDPSFLSFISWIVAYGILVFDNAKTALEFIKEKRYFETVNLMVLSSFLMFIAGFKFEALFTMFVYQTINALFKKNYVQLVERLVKQMDKTVDLIKVKDNDVYTEKQVEEVEQGDVILLNTGDTCLFEGKVVEGEVVIDTLLMDGNSENTTCKIGSRISSGAKIISGGANLEVIKTYHETKLHRLYQFNLSDLEEAGYLEQKEDKKIQIYTMVICVISLIGFVAGVITKKPNVSLAAAALLVACPSTIVLMLKQFIYQFEMIKALKNNVIIKDESSLSKIIEELRKYYKQPNNDIDNIEVKSHLGGYKRQNIQEECDCIYESKQQLENVYQYIYKLDCSWNKSKLYSLIIKLILLFFLLMSFMSYALFIAGVFIVECVVYLNIVKIMDEKVK